MQLRQVLGDAAGSVGGHAVDKPQDRPRTGAKAHFARVNTWTVAAHFHPLIAQQVVAQPAPPQFLLDHLGRLATQRISSVCFISRNPNSISHRWLYRSTISSDGSGEGVGRTLTDGVRGRDDVVGQFQCPSETHKKIRCQYQASDFDFLRPKVKREGLTDRH